MGESQNRLKTLHKTRGSVHLTPIHLRALHSQIMETLHYLTKFGLSQPQANLGPPSQ